MGRAVIQLLCRLRVADSLLSINPQDDGDDDLPHIDRCPSYCDAEGEHQDGNRCSVSAPYCCKTLDGGRLRLKCCANESSRIDDSTDDYNCNSRGSVIMICST